MINKLELLEGEVILGEMVYCSNGEFIRPAPSTADIVTKINEIIDYLNKEETK